MATLYVNPTGFTVQGQSQGNTLTLYSAPTPPAIVGTLLAGQALTQVCFLPRVLNLGAPA